MQRTLSAEATVEMRTSGICLLWLVAAVVALPVHAECTAKSGTQVVPLVELYTAEGCSDCPPADAWLSRLAHQTGPGEATMLALHVDYWDDIGWVDPFADAAHGRRQDFRVRQAKKKVIYTPHVMVGAETNVKWGTKTEVARTLARAGSRAAPVDLAMDVTRTSGGLRVAIDASSRRTATSPEAPDMLWLALYQDGLVSQILQGENEGRTLQHDRVVRALKGPWGITAQPVSGLVELTLEPDVDLKRYGLVLFAESSANGEGLQSLGLPLQSCVL